MYVVAEAMLYGWKFSMVKTVANTVDNYHVTRESFHVKWYQFAKVFTRESFHMVYRTFVLYSAYRQALIYAHA